MQTKVRRSVSTASPKTTGKPRGRHSKTDQEGAGQTIAIPPGRIACPVAALREWIAAAGIQAGAIFRSVNRHSKVGERLTD
jgi:hypothetical protein